MLVKAASHRTVRPRRQQGFTLIEAMVAVAMLAMVISIATPSFRSFIGSISTRSAALDLLSDLMLARSEAIKRNSAVSIEPAGGDWARGWSVTAGDEVLSLRPALGSGVTVAAPAAGATFRPSGRLSDDVLNTRWTVSSAVEGVAARCLQITPTGAARVKSGACA